MMCVPKIPGEVDSGIGKIFFFLQPKDKRELGGGAFFFYLVKEGNNLKQK